MTRLWLYEVVVMARIAGIAGLPRRVWGVAGNAISRRRFGDVVRQALIVVAWAVAAIFLGIIVGYGAIIFSPAGTFGFVAVAGAVLLWVMPDVSLVTDRLVRRVLYFSTVVILCVPSYYAIIVPALPHISVRRIATVPLIIIYMLYVATSAEARVHVVSVIRNARLVFVGAVGFLVMIFLSILTSVEPLASLAGITDVILEWYIPFFAVLTVLRTDREILLYLRIICVSAIFIAVVGVADSLTERNLMVDLLPNAIYQNMMQDWSFRQMIETPQFRNNLFRAPSVFGVSLSFGEFEAIVAPLGAFFFLHGRGAADRIFGFAVGVTVVLGIVASGSRGAYSSLIGGTGAFIGLWVLRERKLNPSSLMAPAIMVMGAAGFGAVFALLMVSQRAYDSVIGDVDPGRQEQYNRSIPLILENPITGHGFAEGARVVGYGPKEAPSLDSYVLSLLVETGVPGFVFFVLMVGAAIYLAARANVLDPSQRGAMNGALASALAGFLVYRLALSQTENQPLMFWICGMIAASSALWSTDAIPPEREKNRSARRM
jgi:O-antigen ligase